MINPDYVPIVTAAISGIVTLIVSIGTWHATERKSRQKEREELKELLNSHKEATQQYITELKDDIAEIDANVQTQMAVIDTKLSTLSDRVEKHNHVIERVYKLEQNTAVQDEQIKVANHRIQDLEIIAAKRA